MFKVTKPVSDGTIHGSEMKDGVLYELLISTTSPPWAGAGKVLFKIDDKIYLLSNGGIIIYFGLFPNSSEKDIRVRKLPIGTSIEWVIEL